MTRNFRKMLEAKWAEGKFVCVGLDSDFVLIPKAAHRTGNLRPVDEAPSIIAFNRAIVRATRDLVCAYKPNLAFYEAFGSEGIEALRETIADINQAAPDVPLILDAKDADIGNTNKGYVKFAFDYLQVDAITVHPYLGGEALEPFLSRSEKGIIVLCRTSNKGAGEFQDRQVIVSADEFTYPGVSRSTIGPVENPLAYTVPLYKFVAHRVMSEWNKGGNCAVVAGATYPSELAEIRKMVGDMPILIPGVGKQGGDLEQVVLNGRDSRNRGMIINSSSAVIFASNGPDFAEAARRETQKLHDQITALLSTMR